MNTRRGAFLFQLDGQFWCLRLRSNWLKSESNLTFVSDFYITLNRSGADEEEDVDITTITCVNGPIIA